MGVRSGGMAWPHPQAVRRLAVALHLGGPEEETSGVTSQSGADGLRVFPGDAGAVTTSTSAADMRGGTDEDEEIDDDALLDAWEEMDHQAVSVHPADR